MEAGSAHVCRRTATVTAPVVDWATDYDVHDPGYDVTLTGPWPPYTFAGDSS